MRIVSNETRDKLIKMGLSQETMFVMVGDAKIKTRKEMAGIDNPVIEPIYDLSFLVEALPCQIYAVANEDEGETMMLEMWKEDNVGGIEYRFYYAGPVYEAPPDCGSGYEPIGYDNNPAEATAQLLIYIVEQGYAETKNGKVVAV